MKRWVSWTGLLSPFFFHLSVFQFYSSEFLAKTSRCSASDHKNNKFWFARQWKKWNDGNLFARESRFFFSSSLAWSCSTGQKFSFYQMSIFIERFTLLPNKIKHLVRFFLVEHLSFVVAIPWNWIIYHFTRFIIIFHFFTQWNGAAEVEKKHETLTRVFGMKHIVSTPGLMTISVCKFGFLW